MPAGAQPGQEQGHRDEDAAGGHLSEEARRAGGRARPSEATKTDNFWGNQIRSYVFQPYTMVNDHRTEVKVGDVQRVMDGDLDQFIEAYLKQYGGQAA